MLQGMPDYCVSKFKDGPSLHPGIVELNLEKSHIKYIKSFIEMEGNPASEHDILMLTTRSFKELSFDSHLTPRQIEEVYAMDRAMHLLESFYKQPLNPDHLDKYNFSVVVGAKKEFAGKLRKTDATIGGTSYRPPQFELLPRIFSNMFQAIALVEGDINKAISYLLAISKNQFFIDGNKRTARIAALHQLSYGRQKLLSFDVDTIKYLSCLRDFYETGDNNGFGNFFFDNLISM